MGYDIYIAGNDFNYTYNIEPMLRLAMGESTDIAIVGVVLQEWRPTLGHWRGAIASEFAGVLEAIRGMMLADPEKFRALNPSNGWGDYEGCLEWLDRMRVCCRQNPNEKVDMWL